MPTSGKRKHIDSVTTRISSTKRTKYYWMDTEMESGRSIGTQTSNKRARTDAEEGAEEVGSGLQVTRPPRAIPHVYNNNYTVKLTYADSYQMSIPITGTGGYDSRIWQVNSLYDPDYTTTGHQPFGRDLWASMYDYYAILACDYDIEVYNACQEALTWTGVGSSPQRIGAVAITLIPTTTTGDITSLGTGTMFPAAEAKNTVTRVLAPEQTISMKGTLTPGDFIVDAKDADSDTTWTAQGSNPVVGRYLGLIANRLNTNTLAGVNRVGYAVLQIYCKLNFTVQFTQVNPTLRNASS